MRVRAEEGTEYSRQVFFGDASAVVSDFYHHFLARPVFPIAFPQSHKHSSNSVNSLDSISKQPVYGDFDLRRVNLHNNWRRISDEFDVNLPTMR